MTLTWVRLPNLRFLGRNAQAGQLIKKKKFDDRSYDYLCKVPRLNLVKHKIKYQNDKARLAYCKDVELREILETCAKFLLSSTFIICLFEYKTYTPT